MTPHKQLFRHRPDEGQIGDCWRTAIGCLMDRSPHDVPHFVQDCWQNSGRGNQNARAWLALHNLGFIETPYASAPLPDVLAAVGAVNPNTYYLLGGNSRNGVGHSVICLDDRIVWDPAIDDSGITGPMDDGYYWVSFLIPLFLVKADDQKDDAGVAGESGGWLRDNQSVYCALMLCGGHDVPESAVAAWTDEQARQAQEWAITEHIAASDNDDVQRLPMPAWVAEHPPNPHNGVFDLWSR